MILSLLLKKALPFALTFVVGTALGGLTWLFGGSEKKTETIVVTRTYEFGSRCRMRHKLVAESKPLEILSVPDVRYPSYAFDSVHVTVTFGADGKVREVEPLMPLVSEPLFESVERAARQIQFKPELVNGVPVSVERNVTIRVRRD
jgi:hypothetical protein